MSNKFDAKISVVVPVYNASNTIQRCLDSVLNQSYKNIELIVVNDGSTDNSLELIDKLYGNNLSIKIINHEKNLGLFAARITGVENSTGDYIGFVDSDDYVSIDYFRLLHKAMVDEGADIVIGTFYLQQPNGLKEYYNLDPIRNQRIIYHGEEIIRAYMDQRGLFYGWQLVWNKLYRREIWINNLSILKDFSKNNIGLTMTEDIAFSSVLWTSAQKVVNTVNANYIYCISETQSTSSRRTGKEYVENLKQVISVFDFFKTVLEKKRLFEKYEFDYLAWRSLMGRIYATNIQNLNDDSDEAEALLKCCFFGGNNIKPQTEHDTFFYSLKTGVGEEYNWYEGIKEKINDPRIECLSFDVFDTAILRPFWSPEDVFTLLNDYFTELVQASDVIGFSDIRLESEKSCREKAKTLKPAYEDITIDEIYDEMHERYGFSIDIINQIKSKEIEKEIEYCFCRKTCKELYDLAQYLGKRIFFVSDMYLHSSVIEAILNKCGYKEYDEIFVSSEVRLGKYTGNLFRHIIQKYKISPNSWMHIGDNWASDIEIPKRLGLSVGHLIKPIEMFKGNHGYIYTGNYYNKVIMQNPMNHDLEYSAKSYIGLRTMFAICANKLFDNPYISYSVYSDFNADVKAIGYFVLGLYLFSVTDWLCDNVSNSNVNKVQFVARDGWLIKEAYDRMKSFRTLPDSHYFYVSRKALLLSNLTRREDLLSLISSFNIYNCSPSTFLEYFSPIMLESVKTEFLNTISTEGFPSPSKKFASRYEYEVFLKLFSDECWDKLSKSEYIDIVKEYIDKNVSINDALVDVGYSGRVENCIHTLTGMRINSYYIHNNSEIIHRRERLAGFKNITLYDYKPDITGVIREHVFMKCAPSVNGYEKSNGEVVPVFEEYELSREMEIITEIIHDWALEFVNDFMSIFHKDIEFLYYRFEDATQPFEWWLQHGMDFDRRIFSTLEFEDDFGIGAKLNAFDFWNSEIQRTSRTGEGYDQFAQSNELDNAKCDKSEQGVENKTWEVYVEKGICNKSLIRKAFYWLMVDPQFAKQRFRDHLSFKKEI